jgi:ubiquinone/menaquinone biosynthesis C-methylase UbiE
LKWLKSKYDLENPELISVIDDLPLWSAPFGMKLLEKVKLKKNIKVLDIGSGMGFPVLELSQRLGNTCEVYGIDPWKLAVERTNQKIKIWGITNLNIIEGFAEEMPFANEYFDLIISNNGVNNVEDEVKIFQEIRRVAKQGSQLVITVNLPKTFIEFYDAYKCVLSRNNFDSELKKLEEHIDHKRKPEEHTKKIIESAGFKIEEIYRDEFQFKFIDGTTMLNHFTIKLAFLDSWFEFIKKEDQVQIYTELEEDLDSIAKKTGELRLTIPWICINAQKK